MAKQKTIAKEITFSGIGLHTANKAKVTLKPAAVDTGIVFIRKDSENCYLIRTNTTALWFVETKSMGWKLYRYLDKPKE